MKLSDELLKLLENNKDMEDIISDWLIQVKDTEMEIKELKEKIIQRNKKLLNIERHIRKYIIEVNE